MEDLGILEINEEGSTAFKMDTGEFDEYVRLDKWQKTEAMEPIIQGMAQPQKTEQMSEMNDRQKKVLQDVKEASKGDPNIHQIFIARSLAVEETDNRTSHGFRVNGMNICGLRKRQSPISVKRRGRYLPAFKKIRTTAL